MLPKELTSDIIKRLHYVKGQLDGIERMINEDKDADKIITQFKAAEEGLSKAHFLLLDEVFRKGLALKLVEVMNACPGNCQEADKIDFLRKKFPELGLDEITEKMKEVDQINERMQKGKEQGDKKDE
jgi:CsoR family transcriptional regulator, copper-sensing transcriptional repressor